MAELDTEGVRADAVTFEHPAPPLDVGLGLDPPGTGMAPEHPGVGERDQSPRARAEQEAMAGRGLGVQVDRDVRSVQVDGKGGQAVDRNDSTDPPAEVCKRLERSRRREDTSVVRECLCERMKCGDGREKSSDAEDPQDDE
jgi:hypothetical protein